MTIVSSVLLMQGEVVVQVPPLPPFPELVPLPPWMVLSEPALVLISLGFFAATVLITFPLIRAIARRLEGRRAPDTALLSEMDELRARVAEMEQQQDRLHELEERIDFTERLLAQQREQARLPH